jgi:dynein light intermediate chain 1
MNVWQLEGEEEHKPLLQFALNANSILNSLVIITLDFSQPWDLVFSLTRWLKILTSHVESIYKQLDKNVVNELKQYRKNKLW